jgi:dipeptide/tripeptide permease
LATVTEAPPQTGHPKGFYFIFAGELAERASFYGMKAVLTMYLVHVFLYQKSDASSLVHLYVAGCYFAPLIGGLLADRVLNKYWTIVGFSVPYILGQFLVGLSMEYVMFGALCLLALGSGIIKPNISTLMGLTYDQQRPGNDQLRTAAFGYFYMAINMGSFLSTLACPALRNYFAEINDAGDPKSPESARLGYLIAFMFPAILMTLALGLFAAGKKFYATEELGFRKVHQPSTLPEDSLESKIKIVTQLSGLFLLVMFFWAIFDQHSSTWIFFAKDYLDLKINTPFGQLMLSPDQIQAANPFLIVIFVPIMNFIYKRLALAGFKIRPTDKMILGFLMTALAMAIHSFAGYAATQPDGSIAPVSILWQIGAFLAITIAEILISVTGLELAFTAAPKSMKGFVTSLWLSVVGIANLAINTSVTRLYPGDGPTLNGSIATPMNYFNILTGAMLIVTGAFVVVAYFFNKSQKKV